MDRDSPTPSTGPSNLLLQTGDHGDCDEAACMDLLGVADPTDVDVLFVTFTKSARERLDALKRHADAPPANVGVVSVQVGGSSGGDSVGGSNGPAVRRISDPSDLTGVGIAISEFLSAWSGNDNRTVVCFESLTALLQYVDASRVFQFCNEITSKFDRAGAHAHFHITPEAHERQVLSVLSSLFDGRVDATDLGHGAAADDAPAERGDEATDLGIADDATPPSEEPEPDIAGAESPDETGADPGDETEADSGDDDPFEYAVAEGDEESADVASADPDSKTGPDESTAEAGSTDDDPTELEDDSTGTDDVSERESEADPDRDGDATPDSDPADLVSSVIDGDADVVDPSDPEDGDAGPSLDADVPDTGGPADQQGDDRPEATSRRTGNGERRRRLEYIGPDASGPETTSTGTEASSEAEDEGDADGRFDRYTFYQRTTATVVGVVAMLVLISFLTAGMPLPLGTDAPGDGAAEVTATPTPEAVAAADATGEATATETSTPEPTATPTPTPTATPDSSTSSSSSTSDSSGGSTADPTATETSTPEPTATPTETPTPTPTEDDSLTDGIDEVVDGTTDGVDEVTGSLSGDDEDDSLLGL